MMRRVMGLCFMTMAAACGGGGNEGAGAQAPHAEPAPAPSAPAPNAPSATPAAVAAGPTAKDQAATGAKLYGDLCASCHGSGGEGKGKAPAVVGKSALPLDPPAGAQFRKEKFKTAGDVYAFVKAKMPPKNPNLTDEQTAAILAFDLQANGVDLTGKPALDKAAYDAIVLHP